MEMPLPHVPALLHSPPAVDMNEAGEAILSWMHGDGRFFSFMAERDAGGGWATPERLSYSLDDEGEGSRFTYSTGPTSGALDEDGHALVVWLEDGPGADPIANYQVFSAERDDAGTWTFPSGYASSISPQDTDFPSSRASSGFTLAANDAGQAIAAWAHFAGAEQIFLAERDEDGVWSRPAELDEAVSILAFAAASPFVVMNASGEAIAIWVQGLEERLWVKERAADGTWGDAFEVDPEIEDARLPHMAMNDAGQAIIATSGRILERDSNGDWTASDSPLAYHQPRVAIDDAGEAVIVDWKDVEEEDDGDGGFIEVQGVQAIERDAAGSWSEPFDVGPDEGTKVCPLYGNVEADGLRVVMNSSGRAIVSWAAYGGAFKAERDVNGHWTRPQNREDSIVSEDNLDACGMVVDVAINDVGEIVLAWEQRSQTEFGTLRHAMRADRDIFGNWTFPENRLDSISTDFTRNSTPPTVAINAAGKAIVEWKETRGYGGVVVQLATLRDAGGAPWSDTVAAPWTVLSENTSASGTGTRGYSAKRVLFTACGEALVGVHDVMHGPSVIEHH